MKKMGDFEKYLNPIFFLKLLTLKLESILRDSRNAPFYIHCIFHMLNMRMFSLSYFIILHNGP